MSRDVHAVQLIDQVRASHGSQNKDKALFCSIHNVATRVGFGTA